MQDSEGTTYFTYDNNSRLATVTYPGESQWTNNFDWVGNRLTLPPDTNTLEYNSADQLTRWPSHHQYEYYDTGSLSDQWDDGTNLQKYYAYTNANLLASVTHYDVQGDPLSEMEWDADGNRITLTISTGGTYYFVYDPTAGVPAVVEQNRQTSHHYYIREPGGELIARMTGTEPVLRYYHFDALGSTRLLTDDDGNVTDEYVYDAWGELTDHTEHTGSVTQPFMFVGQLGYYSHYQDENLFNEEGWQLLQLGVRFYDAEVGRFSQPGSPYAYANNAPSSKVASRGEGAGEAPKKPDRQDTPWPGCSPQKNKDINVALKKICDALKSGKCSGKECRAEGVDPQCFMDFCANPHIVCEIQDSMFCRDRERKYCGSMINCKPGVSQPGKEIYMCPLTWKDPGCDKWPGTPGHPVMGILLHELNHICGDCEEDPNTLRVGNCLKEIFGGK